MLLPISSEETQSLWLIDNESAFLSAYSLIYGEFHRRLLETNCVFRRKTIQRLFALVKSPDPSQLLLRYVRKQSILHDDSRIEGPSCMYRARLKWAPGLVNYVSAVAYHFCLSLPAAFSRPGRSLLCYY